MILILRFVKRNTELAVPLAGEDTRGMRTTGARAFHLAAAVGFSTGVEVFAVWMGDMMDKEALDRSALTRDSPRAACKDLIILAAADTAAKSNDTSGVSCSGSAPTCEEVLSRGTALMDLGIV